LLHNFFSYDQTFMGGVRVGAADVNSDGRADIITGPGSGALPRGILDEILPRPEADAQVKVFSGNAGAQLANFLAYPQSYQGGIWVAGAGPATPAAAPATIPPWASAVAANVTTAGSSGHPVTATYADNTGINVSTLDGADMNVTGPNAFGATPVFISVDVNSN